MAASYGHLPLGLGLWELRDNLGDTVAHAAL
jgi:hypothetical protein